MTICHLLTLEAHDYFGYREYYAVLSNIAFDDCGGIFEGGVLSN